MRPTPIPDAEVWDGAERRVIAGPNGDLTDTTIASVEALVDDSSIGRRFSMRCMPEGDDLDVLRAGGAVWVSVYGQQLQPFSVDVAPTDHRALRPSLRIDVDDTDDGPRFDLFVTGLPEGTDPRVFVAGCLEAAQTMLDQV